MTKTLSIIAIRYKVCIVSLDCSEVCILQIVLHANSTLNLTIDSSIQCHVASAFFIHNIVSMRLCFMTNLISDKIGKKEFRLSHKIFRVVFDMGFCI